MAAPLLKLGATVVLIGAQMAIGAARKIEGPRLDSTKVTLAEYGTPLQDFYGVRRLEGCPLIWADDLHEKKEESKTKGGKYAEYKYFADFAVAILGHEIDAVSRIWMDNHLVYQKTSGGPVSPAVAMLGAFLTDRPVKLANGKNMRIYLGTDDQEPDRIIESWFEDHDDFGADCTPAFRGTAYIVFEGLPVEKFGNRIPTVTVEAVSSKADAFISDEVETDPPGLGGLNNFSFSPDFSKFFVCDVSGPPTPFSVWDVPSRTELYSGGLTGALNASGSMGIDNDGLIYAATFSSGNILRYGTTGGNPTIIFTAGNNQSGVALLRDGAGKQYIGTFAAGGTQVYFGPLDPLLLTAFDPSTYNIVFYCEDGHGDIWALGAGGAGSTTIHFHRMVNYSGRAIADYHAVTVAAAGPSPPLYAVHSLDDGSFLVFWNGTKLYVIDDTTFAITITEDFVSSISGTQRRFVNHPIGNPTIWIGADEISVAAGEILRTVDYADWTDVSIQSGDHGIYDPINDALLIKSVDGIAWLYLDRIGSNGPTLGSVIEAEAAKVGLVIDGSDLDQTVAGYSVTQGPVRDRIAPLLDLHDSIIRPHGFGLEGLKHSSTALGTISVEDFVREGDSPRYEIDEAQATDLPAVIELKWADSTSDQQINSVPIPRHVGTTDSSRVQPIDLSTYVDTPTGMVQKGERFLRAQWNRRATVKNGITAKYLSVEPGDVYNLNLDGVVWTVIAERLTFSALTPKIDCEWRRTFASTLGSGSGAGMTGREPDVIIIPGPTKGFVLDIPLVEDADNSVNPQLYYAAGGYNIAWPGAAILQGNLDGANYSEWQGVPTSEEATWGFAADTLGNANPNLWDRGNVLTVNVYGTLTSSTEAAINADDSINLAVLRNSVTGEAELLNFATATLTGTNGSANVYELTNLLRGRRGTEWAVDGHATGDEFVLAADLRPVSRGLSEVGTDLFYKAQTLGRSPEGAQVIEVDFSGASLKPYAPVIDSVTKDPSTGDIEIVIRTRTRIGGAWNGSVIPTGETIAEYEFDVLDTGTVVRTLESTDKTFSYSAANQTTDFGAEIEADELEGFAYQLSATVGRGFARAA